jgi:acetyltransferase-like isoleucine patch superfamily enzyme
MFDIELSNLYIILDNELPKLEENNNSKENNVLVNNVVENNVVENNVVENIEKNSKDLENNLTDEMNEYRSLMEYFLGHYSRISNRNDKLTYVNLIHPSVKINSSIQIGKGNIICQGAVLTVDISLANHVIININSTIGHDAVIEDFVSIMFGVHISGNVRIGEGTYIGSGAVVLPNTKIGKWCTIGAGSVVTKDVPDNSIIAGVPAKEIGE